MPDFVQVGKIFRIIKWKVFAVIDWDRAQKGSPASEKNLQAV